MAHPYRLMQFSYHSSYLVPMTYVFYVLWYKNIYLIFFLETELFDRLIIIFIIFISFIAVMNCYFSVDLPLVFLSFLSLILTLFQVNLSVIFIIFIIHYLFYIKYQILLLPIRNKKNPFWVIFYRKNLC